MLVEMRDVRKCQEDKLSKSLLDIKDILETITSSLATQSTSPVVSSEWLPQKVVQVLP